MFFLLFYDGVDEKSRYLEVSPSVPITVSGKGKLNVLNNC